MAEKKKFLLRIDEKIYAALEKWAADELRSINAQIEFLLTEALKKSGRLPQKPEENNPIEPNNPIP
ncbi:MAG: Arc family DNA-binding protein [Ignavibacterium sp.]|uniref:Arc family DNA-binding protein n=1 Tax=Ignavibacterium sp. TaxID=2651167 RepID=UPI004049547E